MYGYLYTKFCESYIKENNGHDGSNEEPQWYLIENGFSRLIPDIQTVHLMGWNETDFQRISPDGSSAFKLFSLLLLLLFIYLHLRVYAKMYSCINAGICIYLTCVYLRTY